MAFNINLTFLGTSAQIPSAKRNHPAILLTYEGENILIDCGEGTQRQFRKARLNPCRVGKILITHIHGDHVFGLPGLLSTLSLSGYSKTLYIYGPKGIKDLMNSLLKIFKFEKNFEIKVEEVSGKFFESKDFYLEAEAMKHRIPSNAYCFVKKGLIRIDKKKLEKNKIVAGPHLQKLKEGKNISYKGKKYLVKDLTFEEKDIKLSFVLDTLDNKRIIPFVKNSKVLVCESNFGDELKDQAKKHMHLTSVQAATIAKKAKAEKFILKQIIKIY